MFKVYKKLFSYVPEYKFVAYLAILLAALSSILSIGAFYFVYQFLNRLIVQNNATDSAFYAMIIMVMMVASILIYMFAGGLTHLVAFRLETNLRKKGIDALTTSNFSYFDTTTSGKIRKTIDDNAAETHTIIAHLIPDNTTSFVTAVVLLGITFAINAYMGIALLVLAAVAIFQITNMMGNAEFMKSYMQSLENMNSETVEYVRGMQVIKIFKTSVQSFKALYQAIKDYSDYALNYSFSCRQAYVIFQVMFAAYTVLFIPIYTALVPQSQHLESVPQFIFFFCAVGLMYLTSMKIMYVFMYIYKGDISAEKIETICEEMTSNRVSTGQEEVFADGSIRFENVSFGYEEQNIIEDLSFTLDENKVYAFVGSSGSGKSTIAKLSGGERQRLSIARAILKQAPIVLLDEITSSLDIENEKLIQESLNYLLKDKTVLIISHRLKSVENADKIVVLKDGQIDGIGRHTDLLESSAVYRELIETSQKIEDFKYKKNA